MNKAYIVSANGKVRILPDRPTLKGAQEIVGGWIDILSGKSGGKVVTLIVDEEGKQKGKQLNTRATEMFRKNHPGTTDHVVGDVLILEGWLTTKP